MKEKKKERGMAKVFKTTKADSKILGRGQAVLVGGTLETALSDNKIPILRRRCASIREGKMNGNATCVGNRILNARVRAAVGYDPQPPRHYIHLPSPFPRISPRELTFFKRLAAETR